MGRLKQWRKPHQVAVQINAEVAQRQPNPSWLEQLRLFAVTGGAGAPGKAAATDLAHLARRVLQTL